MPQLLFEKVLDVSSQDDKYPAENMTRKYLTKWLCKKGEANHMISATFQLPRLIYIGRVDIGTAKSASVSVLVSRTGSEEYKELIGPLQLRTEAECRSGEKLSQLKLCCDIREDVRHEKWDIVRVHCYHPYRRPEGEQFGLQFISVWEASIQLRTNGNMEKFKEAALRTSVPAKKEISFSIMTRAQKMVMAAKSSPPRPSPSAPSDDDMFKATVISFLDANSNTISSKSSADAKSELIQNLQEVLDRKLNLFESRIFTQLFRSYSSAHREKLPSGILTPRTSNNQLFTSPGSKKMEDTKISLLKPQLNESFNAFSNNQTVYWAEVVHNHNLKDGPVSYMGKSGKENTPYLLEKNGLTNGEVNPVPDKKMCLDQPQRDKFSPRDSWKNRNDMDKCDSRDCSPDTWLKRKAENERSLPINKKRPRDNGVVEDGMKGHHVTNRVTPAGGWLMGNAIYEDKQTSLSPPDTKKQGELKFPYRVSPPPPPSRPASPLALVDDIDQPSTSSRETVAERNIRLDLERRLAERSPPERVVQRTSAGKVKGPFCTKGMNTNDSPLRRLSICDESEESPQARRKLSFFRQNGQDAESEDLVECPVCKCFFESCDIHKHLDDCGSSPIKRPDDGENEDEMACPICGLWQPKDTVAAHADECAQKRYGA